MTSDLRRRLAALEVRSVEFKPVSEMTDAELLALAGLSADATNDELARLLDDGPSGVPPACPS